MAGGKSRRDSNEENNGPVKRPRRSDRIAILQALDQGNSLQNVQAGAAGQRSVSVPKMRCGPEKAGKQRLSAPVTLIAPPTRPPPVYQAGFGSIPEDLLITVVHQLCSRDTGAARLVCRAWKQGIDSRIQKLRPESAWSNSQLETAVRTFTAVRSLDLNSASSINNIELLKEFRHLQHLRVSHISLSQEKINSTFNRLRQLVTLSLVTCFGMKSLNLTGYNKLERLDLTGTIFFKTLSVPALLPKLTSLCLRECRRIDDWAFLQKLPALQALDLSYTEADDGTMVNLLRLDHLRLLVVMHCRKITDEGIQAFNLMPSLMDVHMDGCSSTTEDKRASLMKDNPGLNLIACCF